ncbi:hypothetical protein VR46_10960 [Streptomyces sp. NRRL S-444]|nr:hypothetical protein VR46_10960 [Streptomyces sp. NRRL S-444]
MSLQDDLTAVRRNLNELVRSVERQAPDTPGAPRREGMVPVPDAPYDSSLWKDVDDEGLGARDRRAP